MIYRQKCVLFLISSRDYVCASDNNKSLAEMHFFFICFHKTYHNFGRQENWKDKSKFDNKHYLLFSSTQSCQDNGHKFVSSDPLYTDNIFPGAIADQNVKNIFDRYICIE